jgi:hypothetical protein
MADDTSVSTRFLKWAFGSRWQDVLVTSFPESPADKKTGWPVWRVGSLIAQKRWPLPAGNNNYFCVSLFSGPRQEVFFTSLHVVALDDVGIGKKVDPGIALAKLGVPGWSWETSPGNQQWFYRLKPAVTDVVTAKQLGYFIKSDAKSVTRVMRLPMGTNTKADYGGKFATRLMSAVKDGPDGPGDLGPDDVLKLSQDVIDRGVVVPGAGTGLTSRVGKSTLDLIGKDLVGGWLYRLGYVKGMIPSRLGVEIVCPWEHEHTIKTETGAAYFPDTGGFECHHGHCASRTGLDLRKWLEEYVDKSGLWPGGVAGGLFDKVPDTSGPLYRDVVLDQYVFVETENRYFDRLGLGLISIDAFNSARREILRPWLTVATKKAGKDTVAVLAPHAWFTGPGRGRIVYAQSYWPGREFIFDEAGRLRVNLYRPAPRPCLGRAVDETMIAPWLELVDAICEAEGPDVAEWVLDWFALIVAAPDIKPGWGLVLQSDIQGIGKDMMLWPILRCVGDGNYATPAAGTLGGGFNPFAEKRFVSVTDLARNTRGATTTHDIYETIKPWTENTSRMIEIRKIYTAPYHVPNVSAWVITSNAGDALPLSQSDRRFLVVMSPMKPLPGAFYADLKTWLEGEGWGLISEYLHRRYAALTAAEKARLMAQAPMTPGKQAMIRLGEDRLTAWTREQIEDKHWPDLMTSRDIQDAYDRAGRHVLGFVPTANKWAPIVSRLGAKQWRDGVALRLGNFAAMRMWIMRCPSGFESFTTKEITQAYTQHRQLFAPLQNSF